MPVWKSVGAGLTGRQNQVCRQLGQELDGQEHPWEQNRLPPIFNIIQIASAKYRSARGASHQPAFMDSYLTINHACMPYLHSR